MQSGCGPENVQPCIVCGARAVQAFAVIDTLRYYRCAVCEATFLDPSQRLSREDEHQRYRLHKNDPADPGYRRFLARLSTPLVARLASGCRGLDYGCGPEPVLAGMLAEAGHRMRVFDPLFFPDRAPLDDSYDFITCSEVLEHCHHPAEEFARFDRLLRPGGWLALMTCFQTEDHRFAHWHYRRDRTHVVFFRATTLRLLARGLGWQCEIPVKNVALLRKPQGSGPPTHSVDGGAKSL